MSTLTKVFLWIGGSFASAGILAVYAAIISGSEKASNIAGATCIVGLIGLVCAMFSHLMEDGF